MKSLIIGAARWIIDYLEIPNYLNVKAHSLLGGEKIYNSEEVYWNDVLGPSFYKRTLKNPITREGDVVVLQNFQLSPWSPRLPGLYWTIAGKTMLEKTDRLVKYDKVLGHHYEPNTKRQRMLRGGMGTVRLAKHERYQIYGATSSGNLDAAIPVVITSNVSKNLLRFSKKNPLMEVDLRGTVKIIPQKYQSHYWGPHIPKVCLIVDSILNVDKYISDFSLNATAWTIYHNPKTGNDKKKYGYTYAHFNPIEESNIIDATNWIHEYIDEYASGNGIAITDYDEIVPRFQSATLPLSNIMDGNIDYDALASLFGGIDFRQQSPLFQFA